MQDSEKPKRGGKRAGSGRKPGTPKTEITVSLDTALVNWLDTFGPQRRSSVVNLALNYYKQQDDALK